VTGAQGIEVVPVTAANRAARLLAERPVHAIAGPALELQSLVQRSAIKLESVRAIIFAWMDDDIAATPAATHALEALMAEVPKGADRTLLARRATPHVEEIIDRYLRTARRVTAQDTAPQQGGEGPVSTSVPVRYITVSASSRPAALRRLLDQLDPPSATILVRDPAAEADAVQTVRSLGYRRANDPVQVAGYDAVPETHTIILYDVPVMPSDVSALAAAGAVQIVALVTPREVVPFHELVSTLVPYTLEGPGTAARSRDALLRDELSALLSQGVATRELLALEPLLERFDGVEIAAAAVRLLERERGRLASVGQTGLQLIGSQSDEGWPREPRGTGESGRGGRRDTRNQRGGDERGGFRGSSQGGRQRNAHNRDDSANRDRSGRGEPPPRRPRDEGRPERRERDLGRGPRSGGGQRRDPRR
jgi:hypothetical protein